MTRTEVIEVASALLGQIRRDIGQRFGVTEPGYELLVKVQGCTRQAMPVTIKRYLEAA